MKMRGTLLIAVASCLARPLCGGPPAASESGLAFLAPTSRGEPLGPEALAARELVCRLCREAVTIFPGAGGDFVDDEGRAVSLDRFRVIWMHQGDVGGRSHTSAGGLETLRGFVAGGGGLLLSGAALALVHDLGIESTTPRWIGGGRDEYLAMIAPQEPDHPIFRGLEMRGVFLDAKVGGNPRDCTVAITDRGLPASADFFGTGGPRGGRLLARAASLDENPLVEYELGKGRVIVLGWRLPHYANATNAHRRNLERLTSNILGYLTSPGMWRSASPRAPPERRPGIPPAEWEGVEMAVRDLMETFPGRYPRGPSYLERLEALWRSHDEILAGGVTGEERPALETCVQLFQKLRIEALLDNPLLDFERLLVLERKANNLGLPANYHGNPDLPKAGYENRLAVLSPVGPGGSLTTLYQSDGGRFVGDVDLDFDAGRLLFSMPGSNGQWQVHEMPLDDPRPRELPLIHEPDVDNCDACYLPDGRIVFSSTATFAGVPCVYGASPVTNLYLLELDGRIRQLTVDQDHDWCPTVLNDGRVMYLRWEYADLPHSNSRILFRMHPDGTGQMEYYGTNSFFPNSFFHARPIPGHPTKVVGIATGHHGVARAGRLLIVDPALGHVEAQGVVQEIPGRGKKVEPSIRDELVDGAWPQFLHPWPLSEKYFLVSSRSSPDAHWGIYLVDVFDNRVLLKEVEGYALLEPIPLRKIPRPPIIADNIEAGRTDALIFLKDVYAGGGLKGIPRGAVKKLRLFTYHYAYRGMGGLLGTIGMDGPWDLKMVLGTVPVEADGSALFRVPASTPISVQPLDEEGRALQIMRSWFTAMPGESLSCIGCHERQEVVALGHQALAAARPPSEITPWHGAARGFSFEREVQPVLDRHCVGCHDGGSAADFRRGQRILDWRSDIAGSVAPSVGGKFSAAYAELQRYVRRPGIESDIHLLSPMEFHASATELVQMLRKGHQGVELDSEAWDRIVTWIDLNAPYHGTWSEIVGADNVRALAERRRLMSRRYAAASIEGEDVVASGGPRPPAAAMKGRPAAEMKERHAAAPLDEIQAPVRLGPFPWRKIALGSGIDLELVLLPAGEFLMGDARGDPDEGPVTRVTIDRPFWIGRFEITNAQFALFDPSHDSHVEPMHGYQFGIHGYPVDGAKQPAVRVSWQEAVSFCRWLSARTGRELGLPTEAQWEYACRAGTRTPLWYGDLDADFSVSANLGDAKLAEFVLDTYIRVRLVPRPNRYDDRLPKEARFDDRGLVSVDVGSYRPNPWGLHDTHGNVWEWTQSLYSPYPYRDGDGRNDLAAAGDRVVRGGSWHDRPRRCRSAFRLAYKPYQKVFDVGFRVVLQAEGE